MQAEGAEAVAIDDLAVVEEEAARVSASEFAVELTFRGR